MTFIRSRTPTRYDYYILGMKIVRVDDLVDLGFKLSRTLSPSPLMTMIFSILVELLMI